MIVIEITFNLEERGRRKKGFGIRRKACLRTVGVDERMWRRVMVMCFGFDA